MHSNNMWQKTHEALSNIIQELTCKKCHRKLKKAKQFLNCGHFACSKCVANETECLICKIPGEAADILTDRTINNILININIIAEEVKLPLNLIDNRSEDSSDSSSTKSTTINTNSQSTLKKNTIDKIYRCKEVEQTLNYTKYDLSTTRSTNNSKHNEFIPKRINKKNKKGETPLHIACRTNNEERARILLRAGANPNTKDNAGWTPLQESANFGLFNICELLLQSGALTDTFGFDNRTALHEAVINEDYDMVVLLMSYNANTNVFDNEGKNPLHYSKTKKISAALKKADNCTDKKTYSETISEPAKIGELDQSIVSSISESKIILYGSNLNQKNRKLLCDLAIEKKLKIVNTFSSSVSHVIIDLNESNYVKPTIDILLTILNGKWLVSSDCLSILIESENIMINDFSLFEVNPPHLDDSPVRARENLDKLNPKLFNCCNFYFSVKNNDSISYDGMNVTKENLMKLVTAGDGTILSREPRPEDIQGSLSPFHVAHDPKHSLHKCTHYVIYFDTDPKNTPNRIIYNMPFLKSLPFMWFIESILKFKLIDPTDLGLFQNS